MKGGLFPVGFTALVLILTFNEVSAMVCEREVAFGFTQRFSCPQPTDSKDKIYCCGTKENRFCCDTPFGLDEDVMNQVIDMSSDSNVTDINIPTTQALKVRKFSKTKPMALAQVQEAPVAPKTSNDQEGIRDSVDRLKEKANDTLCAIRDKLNPNICIQKAKDKVKVKIEEKVAKKLDPTGTIRLLPTILTVIGVFILVIIVVCIVCCCCCPFCILHKRRNRGAVHNPNTADVTVTQPLQPMQPMQQPYASPQPYPPQPYPSQPYPPQPQPYPPAQGYPGGYPQQPYPPQAPQPAMYPVDQPPPYSEKQLPYNPNYQQ
ncbi:uncharacterized protein [Macrobrachium rosenbergii]|uniref:uncharacterized protein isoform X1 n=1 Tax=Macrobrachium rosenbergii TaxID=79674 RepID=UPI0034D789BC